MGMRNFVLGAGTGILAATLILSFGNMFQSPQEPSSTKQAPLPQTNSSPADWQQAAKSAGMVLMKQADLDQKLAQARADGAQQKAAELAASKASAPPAPPSTVFVYIQPGMGTAQIAMLLQAAGVLEDGNQLIQRRAGTSTQIRAGTYQLPLKGNLDDVWHTITTPHK